MLKNHHKIQKIDIKYQFIMLEAKNIICQNLGLKKHGLITVLVS